MHVVEYFTGLLATMQNMALAERSVVLLVAVFLTINSQETTKSAPLIKIFTPRIVYIAVGHDLSINCSVHYEDSVEHPQPSSLRLSWKYEESLLAGFVSRVNNITATLELPNVTYHHAGVYSCDAIAKDKQNEDITLKSATTTVHVGEPPDHPSPPSSLYFYGWPPNDGALSFRTSTSSSYSVTYEVWLSWASKHNMCMDVTNPAFRVEDSCTRVQHNGRPGTFNCNVAKVLKKRFSVSFPGCSGYIDCTSLCAFVRAWNVFGSVSSKPTHWSLKSRTKCGWPRNLKTVDVQRTNVTLSWRTPVVLKHTTKLFIHFYLRCSPSCGEIDLLYENLDSQSEWNYTVKVLTDYTSYTFSLACSFLSTLDANDPNVSLSVWTKEGVPTSSPPVSGTYIHSIKDTTKTIRITWKQPPRSTLHGRITKYVIEYWKRGGSYAKSRGQEVPSTVDVYGNTTTGFIEGLDRYSNYSFKVKVCTGGGCSRPSAVYYVTADFKTSTEEPTSAPSSDKQWMTIITIFIGMALALAVIVTAYISFKFHQWRRQRYEFQHRRRVFPVDLKPAVDLTIVTAITEPNPYSDATMIVPCDVTNSTSPSSETDETSLSRSSSSATCSTIV